MGNRFMRYRKLNAVLFVQNNILNYDTKKILTNYFYNIFRRNTLNPELFKNILLVFQIYIQISTWSLIYVRNLLWLFSSEMLLIWHYSSQRESIENIQWNRICPVFRVIRLVTFWLFTICFQVIDWFEKCKPFTFS